MIFANTRATTYNDTVVRQFAIMTVVWGVVGMLIGVIIAAQLAWPALNMDVPWLGYGRLRNLHTNAVIFAFGCCGLMGTSLYVVQRTCQVRLFSDKLAAFVFWGWQAVLVAAVISLPLGYTQSREYAELEWPIDVLITLVWVAYAFLFFGTVGTRKVKHIYVANWFYGAFIIAIAMLHLVNNAAIPVGFMKSYSAYAGVQDAMVQWWYGHNAVGFLLTAGFLGMMYYFIPKQAERPVYSYRLSIVHFWALIFTYMWAGPHHLHYTALPDWTQSVGMVFSLILLAPSWGGMINVRRPDDGQQNRQCAVALHRLDDWPCAFRCAGLGGLDHYRQYVLPDSPSLRPEADVQHEGGGNPFLDSYDRHRDLYRRHVDCRRDAGLDVACGQS